MSDKKTDVVVLQNHNHPRDGRHIPGQEVAAEQPVEEDHHREQTGFELAVEHHGRRATGDRTDFRTRPDVTGDRSAFYDYFDRHDNRQGWPLTSRKVKSISTFRTTFIIFFFFFFN